MSVFSGRQYQGAMRDQRDARYRKAVGRQQLLCDRGWYARKAPAGEPAAITTPAPAESLMRAADRGAGTDSRVFAKVAAS